MKSLMSYEEPGRTTHEFLKLEKAVQERHIAAARRVEDAALCPDEEGR